MIRNAFQRMLGEPLVHFAILGALVFGLHAWVAPPPLTNRIVVPAAVVKELRQQQMQRTGVAPTADEEAKLIQGFVDNEILYRQAIALGLDRGDIIVRRRLIQKMEFLNEGLEPMPRPTDAQLQAYLDARAKRYRVPARVSMHHVFVSDDAHGHRAKAIAADLRAALLAGKDPDTLGDPFMRGRRFAELSEEELGTVFGADFAHRVMELPTGSWSQPLRSSYGWHLVRVDEHSAARAPKLSEIRPEVLRDWTEDHHQDAERAALKRLRPQYQVIVENEKPATSQLASAATGYSSRSGSADK